MENTQNQAWERINDVVNLFSAKNRRKFLLAIWREGLYELRDIHDGKEEISYTLACRICGAFPLVSIVWLLTGQGNKMRGNNIEIAWFDGGDGNMPDRIIVIDRTQKGAGLAATADPHNPFVVRVSAGRRD